MFKTILVRIIIPISIIIISFKAKSQTVTYTALAGNSSQYLYANGTNYVVYGFQMTISGVTGYPSHYIKIGNFSITTSTNVNGSITSAQLVSVASANPALALTGTPVGSGNINAGYIGISNVNGQYNNGTWYFYLILGVSNLQNAPPASVTFTLVSPPSDAVFFNNSSNPAPTTSVTNLSTPAIYYFGYVLDWSGANGTSWTSAQNWKNSSGNAPNNPPGANDQARVGVISYSISSNQPAINSASSVGQVIFGANNSPAITVTNNLTVGNGLIVNTGGTGKIIGPGVLSIDGASAINGTGTLTVSSTGIVKLASSTASLTVGSSATFTLASDASGAATISTLPSGASITGNVSVQRYITGGSGYRGYRLISSPVYQATDVNSNNIYTINYLQLSSFITGAANGGFDKTGNPTLYLYREDITPNNTSFISGNFWGISKLNNTNQYDYYMNNGSTAYNIPAGNGVLFFFRGDRNAAGQSVTTETTTSYLPTSTTFTAKGTLNQGKITIAPWYSPASTTLGYSGSGTGTNYNVRGFNLVGNPYPSSINWDLYSAAATSSSAIYAPGIDGNIYILDPTSKNYGVYKFGTPSHTGTHGTTNIIPSGQGFFVRALSSTQLIFNESAKVNTQATGGNLLMGTPAGQNATEALLHLKLIKDSLNNDEIMIGFNSTASPKFVNSEDAQYLNGSGSLESLASLSDDSVKLAINYLPLPKKAQQHIKLNITATASGVYTLQKMSLDVLPAIYEVWLMDNYKKDSLDLRNSDAYTFDIDLANAATFGNSRFSLIIRQNPALGVHLVQFAAAKTTDGSHVTWKTDNEVNYTNFTLERSNDNGQTFNVIGGFISTEQGSYSFLDSYPAAGANQYRLKLDDLNGAITYSNVVTLMYSNNSNNIVINNIKVYPNPAVNTLNLAITPPGSVTSNLSAAQQLGTTLPLAPAPANPAPSYSIKIINITGKVIATATSASTSWQNNVSNLAPGTYIITVVNNSNNKIVGESTFVKM